ncbi:aldehyde dehydrogenase family protein [Pantoea agglomerans]|uniref:aldehyde dehydrogenase family protein n=1 Tax=Enterobacter agglomerans TaxID=549 RepID=UPI001654BBC9|nr:aldehyde dehydrogenase family protein [Pantoea agglomerans]
MHGTQKYSQLEIDNFVTNFTKEAKDFRLTQSGTDDIKLYSPDKREIFGYLNCDDDNSTELKVKIARKAFVDGRWRKKSLQEKRDIFLKMADLIEREKLVLATMETLSVGKPIKHALEHDIPGAVGCIRWMAEAFDKLRGETYITESSIYAKTLFEPIGVIVAIMPWNFPLVTAVWKMAPALITGNSVILKPSEHSSLSTIRLAELALEAGLPEGVLSVVVGEGKNFNSSLIQSGDTDCITATCSTETGKRILSNASVRKIKRTWLECGGKNANIIMPDADNISQILADTVEECTYNTGQVCTSPSKVILHSSFRDQAKDHLKKLTLDFRYLNPTSLDCCYGPMANLTSYQNIINATGANLTPGIEVIKNNSIGSLENLFLQPVVLFGVEKNMKESTAEIFGPVITIEFFDNDEQLNDIIQANPFGLSTVIWSENSKNQSRLIKKVKSGMIKCNTFKGGGMNVPFGGTRDSGFGKDHSFYALKQYCDLKSIIERA